MHDERHVKEENGEGEQVTVSKNLFRNFLYLSQDTDKYVREIFYYRT
jgi:hypothetical protein